MTKENVEDEDGENLEQQLLTNTIRGLRRIDPSKPTEKNTVSGKTEPNLAQV